MYLEDRIVRLLLWKSRSQHEAECRHLLEELRIDNEPNLGTKKGVAGLLAHLVNLNSASELVFLDAAFKVVLAMTSRLMKDMNGMTDMYRANAICNMCRIIDGTLLTQIKRHTRDCEKMEQ
uniref:Coatomer subunit gamma n=1 Tax=Tanacetum cinerariifolium TaxID=118510 RepID=A0A6L2LZ80_TANCI|nr:coatomer subunit gamma [Tanacetum cinerariifolium]